MSPDDLLRAAQAAPPELMREMARAAMKNALADVAAKAEDMADKIPSAVSGPDALRAFARAVRETRTKVWGGSA